MRVILTAREDIVSKTGDSYVKCSFISSNGVVGDIFTTKEKYDGFKIMQSAFVQPDQLSKFFDELPVSEVEFDQRGRMVSLS